MSRRRYEIPPPTRYNDGSPVEPERFFETQEELVAAFGALTTSPDLFRVSACSLVRIPLNGHRSDQVWQICG
jgi:hypothetical protein